MSKELINEIESKIAWNDMNIDETSISLRDVKRLLNELEEQVERIKELEEERDEWKDTAQVYYMTNQELREQNKRYKQALEFYADEETYEPLEVQIGAVTKEGYKISKYKYDPIINTDKGKKARETLGWEENK